MFLNNVKFYIKSIITSTQGVGTTFNISEDFETNTHIETGSDTVSIVLKTTNQIERMTITATGGVATIVKRGLTKLDDGSVNISFQKQWNDGTIGYITALSSDMPDLDKSSGINVFSSDVKVGNTKKYYIGDNAYITTTNNGTDLKLKDGNNSETTLSEITAGTGTDYKLKASVTDTTAGFLDGKLTVGDGLSKTLVNGGYNESIDLDIDLTDTTIFTPTPIANKVPLTDSNGNLSGFVPTTQSTFIAGENITAPAYVRKGVTALGEDTTKIYKTDASNIDKINAIGSIGITVTSGNSVAVDTGGVANYWSSLTTGGYYYISEAYQSDTLTNTLLNGNETGLMQSSTTNQGQLAQDFITTYSAFFTGITLRLRKVGAPTDNITVKIGTTRGGAELATYNIAGTSLTTSYADYSATYDIFIPAGTYYITLSRSGVGDGSNYYVIQGAISGNVYYYWNGTTFTPSANRFLYSITINNKATGIGNISTTLGTNARRIGKAISTTAIELETSANNSLEGTLGTTAITGSVTLGNAVGYVTVKINGVDRKIPYYS